LRSFSSVPQFYYSTSEHIEALQYEYITIKDNFSRTVLIEDGATKLDHWRA